GEGEELDFHSKSFNAAKALSSGDVQLPVPDAQEYEDLESLRKAVHSHNFNVVRDIPGVLGPGGIPKKCARKVPVERNFAPEQGLIKGRGRRRLRNVITRMEEMVGPLAVLRKCQQENIKVKVYVRNHCEVRSMLSGYVVAFDKHWNLALSDVDEVFQKKLRCKTPALGDVSQFVKVGDLSIRDSDSDSSDDSRESKSKSCGGAEDQHTGFSGITGRELDHQTLVSSREESDSTLRHLGAGTSSGLAGAGPDTRRGRETSRGLSGADPDVDGSGRRVIGSSSSKRMSSLEAMDLRARLSVRVTTQHPDTSDSRDARTLQLGRGNTQEKKAREEEEEEEQREGEGKAKKKRVRKRMKREIRKRHVNQLFVRGENVVLISVLNLSNMMERTTTSE
ncbi:hypothetical protein OTU49_002212, partial [Cherax quadricarinatus]